MNEQTLPPGLRKRVDAIAAAEGLDVRAIVLTAVRELVRAFPGPARRGHRVSKMPHAKSRGGQLRRGKASLTGAASPGRLRHRAQAAVEPAQTSANAGRVCVRCDHDESAHIGDGGKCLSARCVCAEFYA